jgi:ribosomal protein L11 methyltransferase
VSSHLVSSHLVSSHLVSSHLVSSHLVSSHLVSSDRLFSDRAFSDLAFSVPPDGRAGRAEPVARPPSVAPALGHAVTPPRSELRAHRAEVQVHPADVEVAAASLWAAGAQGVWERGGGEVVAWFPTPVDLTGVPGLADAVVTWHAEEPRDWQAAWKATIAPVRAGTTVVLPSWLAAEHLPAPGELTLVLDPGQAFGTGHHATTTLCLEALERLDLAGASVADVGCGTGVLAIAAARRGAHPVLAVDLDPDAVEVTRANAARNRAAVDARVGSVEVLPGPADVVVANLVTDTLVSLATDLVAAARRTLVVSGIDAARQVVVVTALAAAGAHVVTSEERDGWAALTAVPGPAGTAGRPVEPGTTSGRDAPRPAGSEVAP